MARVRRRREAALPEIIILAIAFSAPWLIHLEEMAGIGEVAAHWGRDGGDWLPAGLWYRAVTLPILQFFAYRWLWRWIARATTSLPTPLSPLINTVEEVGATLLMRFLMSSAARLRPMKSLISDSRLTWRRSI